MNSDGNFGLAVPPGYAQLVPFDKAQHRGLGVRPQAGRFARSLSSIYVTAMEFRRACHTLPIVFARDANQMLVPVAVTGIDNGHSLVVNENGEWPEDIYCPAYVRRYPFYLAGVRGRGDGQAVVCVDESGLVKSQSPLIHKDGTPTPVWEKYERLIKELQHAERQTKEMCSTLDELNLLEAFDATFNPHAGAARRIGGLLRIGEDRMKSLSAEVVKELLLKGFLACIYAHLLSLNHFDGLLDRYVSRG